MNNIDTVFHFSANADVRYGFDNPRKDIEQNIIITSNILEAMKFNKIKKLFLHQLVPSIETKNIPTEETESFPIQTSYTEQAKLLVRDLYHLIVKHIIYNVGYLDLYQFLVNVILMVMYMIFTKNYFKIKKN